jgi:hypothetical protein
MVNSGFHCHITLPQNLGTEKQMPYILYTISQIDSDFGEELVRCNLSTQLDDLVTIFLQALKAVISISFKLVDTLPDASMR